MAKKAKKAKRAAKKVKPSTHGRDGKGKFAKGNKCSNGSAGHKCVSDAKQLKLALINSVSIQDIKNIAKGLIEKAKTGDVPAVKELFDRLFGKAMQTHEVEIDAGEKVKKFMDWLAGRNGSNGNGSPDKG